MKSSIKRLAKDQLGLRKALPPNYLFEDVEVGQSLPDDLTKLSICLAGPDGTPYAQGLWHLFLNIPLEYPQHPPTATFKTRIFHPNVAEETGAVCLETLKRDWDPKLTLKDILVTISCLLIHPNPDSALNQKAGALIQDDYEAFARQARLMTKIHASTPAQLLELAEEARKRGEESNSRLPPSNDLKMSDSISLAEPTAQKENQLETSANYKHATAKPSKRPLDSNNSLLPTTQEAEESEGRRRKSPKHDHQLSESNRLVFEPTSKCLSNERAEEDNTLPKKIIFRAQWSLGSQGPRTKARIGIRRL